MTRCLSTLGFILTLSLVFGIGKFHRETSLTAEDYAFWEANGRKVTEGWEKGCSAGKAFAQTRMAAGKIAMVSRELAGIAETSLQDSGIDDPVTRNSFKRGFVFGFHQGRQRPDEP